MTPIFVDECDVSKCDMYNPRLNQSCLGCRPCTGIPCHFKLKYLRNEVKRLKTENNEAIGAIDNVRKAKEDLQDTVKVIQKTKKHNSNKLEASLKCLQLCELLINEVMND